MKSNNIETLREHLFSTLEALNNKETPMELARAKAIAEVAQVIVNSAMVEVKFLQSTGNSKSAFLDNEQNKQLPNGITGVTVHRVR